MPFWENMPYTNFHGVNQDWIIQQTKHLVEEWMAYGDNLQQAYDSFTETVNGKIAALDLTWENYKYDMDKAFQDLHDYVYNYFDNLDVQDEIDHKLDEMTAQGLWDDILHSFFDSYTAEIDGKIETQNNTIATQNANIETLQNQWTLFLQTHGTASATLRERTTLWQGNVHTDDDNLQLSDSPDNYDLIEVHYFMWGQAQLQYFRPADMAAYGVSVRIIGLENNIAITPAELRSGEIYLTYPDSNDHTTVAIAFMNWHWSGDHTADASQALSHARFGITEIAGIKYTDISATKDPELTDIRLGADGTVYPTAGDAVRSYAKGDRGMLPENTAWNTVTKEGSYSVGGYGVMGYSDYPSIAAPGILKVTRCTTDGGDDKVLQEFYTGGAMAFRVGDVDPQDETISPGGWTEIEPGA